MALFSSDRERRLWIWALVVAVAIFSTFGLARTLACPLREHGLLGPASFLLGMIFVAGTIAAHGLKVRPSGTEITVALGVVGVYLLMFARIASPAERTHLIEYGVLSIFIHAALTERAKHGRFVPVPPLLAFFITAVVGTLDECIQAILPGRVFDPFDILVNVTATAAAIGASTALAWARRRKDAPPNAR